MDIATKHLKDAELANHYQSNIKNLRNRFLHNEIPYFDWLTKEVENEREEWMCDKIFDVSERYYTDLLRQVKP